MRTLIDEIMEINFGAENKKTLIENGQSFPLKPMSWGDLSLHSKSAYSLLENEFHSPVYNSSSDEELIRKFKNLILFYPKYSILNKLISRKIQIQRIENGSGDLNLDYYPVDIYQFPVLNGKRFTATQFISYIRRNLNYFIDTFYSEFYPFKSEDNIWYYDNPEGAVIEIDIMLPDNAAVVVGKHDPYYWIFSTLDTSNVPTQNVGSHPINGNRQFGIDYVNRKYRFFIRAADRFNSFIQTSSRPLVMSAQRGLWESLQDNVTWFVNNYGGNATAYLPTIKKVNYFKALDIINTL